MATISSRAVGVEPFRTCGACGARWPTAAAFLEDGAMDDVGLQVAAHLPAANLIIFEHGGGSSVSVHTSRLRFLLPDPAEGTRASDLFGTEECQQLCRQLVECAACDRPCINARDHHLLRVLLRITLGPVD